MSSNQAIKLESLYKKYKVYKSGKNRLASIFFSNSNKLYDEFTAIRDVSIEIDHGKIIGIIGKNGSGKSTLLQLICRTLEPTSGKVTVNGRLAAMLELGSGFNPEFTGRENIYLNAAILGLSKEEIDEKINQIIDFSEIGVFIDRPCKTYSSGMYMRLAFSVQAHLDPDILIIDEALAVGDASFVRKCMDHFNVLKKRGVTILLVTHDSTAVKLLCDLAVWMKDGEIHDYGDARRIVDEYLVDIDETISKDTILYKHNYDSRFSLPALNNKIGSLRATITHAGLVNSKFKPITHVKTGEQINLLLEVKNSEIHKEEKILVGYVLKNSRGIDIASSNSGEKKFHIDFSVEEDVRYILIKFDIPHLHSGIYTFDLSLSLLGDYHSECLDLSRNAIEFKLECAKDCHVLMALETEFLLLD